jgi:hypothetical protein
MYKLSALADTSTWKQETLKSVRRPNPRGSRTQNRSKLTAALLNPYIDRAATCIGGRETKPDKLWEEHWLSVYKNRVLMEEFYIRRE